MGDRYSTGQRVRITDGEHSGETGVIEDIGELAWLNKGKPPEALFSIRLDGTGKVLRLRRGEFEKL